MFGLDWNDTPSPLMENSGGKQFTVAENGAVTDNGYAQTLPSTGQAGMQYLTDAAQAAAGKDYATKAATAGTDPWEQIGDSSNVYTNALWATKGVSTAAQLYFKLPANWIPAYSVIDRVQFKVRHYEPTGSGFTYKPKLLAGATASDGSDVEGSSASTASVTLDAQPGPCSYSRPGGGSWAARDSAAATLTLGTGCDSTWGSTQAEAADIVDDLHSAGALNGGEMQLDVTGTGATRLAIIDGVEVSVWSRPPGMLRPLRGCLTLRTGYPVASSSTGAFVPTDPLGVGSPATGLNASWNSVQVFNGTAEIMNGNYHSAGNGWVANNDNAYGTGTQNSDVNSCGLLVFRTARCTRPGRW
jgi:hypothetical protein